jgi:hypothetical protein
MKKMQKEDFGLKILKVKNKLKIKNIQRLA